MADDTLNIEVAYALATVQRLVCLQVPAGTTVRQAAELSGLAAEFPELDIQRAALGIFGKAVTDASTRLVGEGERVEIYRPLIADPKEVRKQRAAKAAAKRDA